jgi:hypothetical protein
MMPAHEPGVNMGEPENNDIVVANVELGVSGVTIQTKVPVTRRAVRPRVMLPIVRAFTGALQSIQLKATELRGETISCRAGCGACCRQLVPLAESEAFVIRDLVMSMDEPRRSQILARFEAALRRLDEVGMTAKISRPQAAAEPGWEGVVDDYFRLGIPCPFLEDESCSIHPDRPVRCREILVTSPAEHCADPDHKAVHTVETPARASNALMRMDDRAGEPYLHWVPLVLALRWTSDHEETTPRPGTDWLQRFLQMLGKGTDYEG